MKNQLAEHINVSIDDNSEPKTVWQRPVIGNIDIRRTMGGSGPNGDSPSGTTVF